MLARTAFGECGSAQPGPSATHDAPKALRRAYDRADVAGVERRRAGRGQADRAARSSAAAVDADHATCPSRASRRCAVPLRSEHGGSRRRRAAEPSSRALDRLSPGARGGEPRDPRPRRGTFARCARARVASQHARATFSRGVVRRCDGGRPKRSRVRSVFSRLSGFGRLEPKKGAVLFRTTPERLLNVDCRVGPDSSTSRAISAKPWNVSASRTAMSASTLRSSWTSASFRPCISCE